jgi:5-methylcytosine-specific restriction endonuclease McrBC regulatory subunit McrC
MAKYKEYFDKMIEENKDIFEKFKTLHNNYSMDKDKYQEEFNKEGEKILAIAHEWENKLCSQSEKAGFSSYTGNLAEKFQAELKNLFPLIDHVGIVVKRFTLKKISLH